MLQRFLLVWLVGTSLLAYCWHSIAAAVGFSLDPFQKPYTDLYLRPLIAVTMFAIGLMLPRDEVRQVIRRWPTVLGGTALQYLSMPLLAYTAATIAGFTGDDLIGVILVGCVPGAMASNVLTMNAGGNTSYSVSLTTAATVLSPLAVPLALILTLGHQQDVVKKVIDSSVLLLLIVVLPVVAGHVIGRSGASLKNWEQRTRYIGSTVANLAILMIIAAVVGLNRERLAQTSFGLFAVLLAINLGGYCVGFFGSRLLRLPNSMRRALTLEIGMQNAGLGATLAVTLFGPGAAIAPAIYTFGCMLTGTALARLWAFFPCRTDDSVRSPSKPLPDLD